MKSRKPLVVIGLACGGGFLVLAICAGGLYWLYKTADSAVSSKIDALFAMIDNGTFGEAYQTETSPELQKVVSREKWQQIGRVVKQRLGRLCSKSLTQFNVAQFNLSATIKVVYDASFEKGPGTISAQFRTIRGEWRVDSLYVNSSLLVEDAMPHKCSHCGAANPQSAKFCNDCGKPLKEAEPARPAASSAKSK
jgi:hypothetical protein